MTIEIFLLLIIVLFFATFSIYKRNEIRRINSIDYNKQVSITTKVSEIETNYSKLSEEISEIKEMLTLLTQKFSDSEKIYYKNINMELEKEIKSLKETINSQEIQKSQNERIPNEQTALGKLYKYIVESEPQPDSLELWQKIYKFQQAIQSAPIVATEYNSEIKNAIMRKLYSGGEQYGSERTLYPGFEETRRNN